MAKQRIKSSTFAADKNAYAGLREEAYHNTLSAQKRHELLMEPYGVNFPTFRTLVYLIGHPEGVEPSKIADDLMILRQSMTNIVDAMQERGLTVRQPHPSDRRRITIRLTPEGQKLAEAVLDEEHRYSLRVRQHFTERELDTYYTLRSRMNQAKELELQRVLEERKSASEREE